MTPARRATIEFLLDNKAMALVAMGNVVLAVTGAEALYADMGHFGRKPIAVTAARSSARRMP